VKTVILGEHQGNGNRYEMYLSAPAGGLAQMIRNPAGNWVPYADYAALKAENERLRKAGDDMDAYIKRSDGTTNGVLDCRRNWHAAKEVQS
jgi:hypothetical protein